MQHIIFYVHVHAYSPSYTFAELNECVIRVPQFFKVGFGTHLFVKVSRPGNSKVTFSVFKSSCHLLLPV